MIMMWNAVWQILSLSHEPQFTNSVFLLLTPRDQSNSADPEPREPLCGTEWFWTLMLEIKIWPSSQTATMASDKISTNISAHWTSTCCVPNPPGVWHLVSCPGGCVTSADGQPQGL